MYELYVSESIGGQCSDINGYYQGKRLANITVQMWRDDIKKGYLCIEELYEDPNYPSWWLDKVLSNI